MEITQYVPEQPMSKREIKKYLARSENGNRTYQNWQHAAKSILKGKFITIKVYMKKKEISNKQPNFTTEGTRKIRINKTRVSRR